MDGWLDGWRERDRQWMDGGLIGRRDGWIDGWRKRGTKRWRE